MPNPLYILQNVRAFGSSINPIDNNTEDNIEEFETTGNGDILSMVNQDPAAPVVIDVPARQESTFSIRVS